MYGVYRRTLLSGASCAARVGAVQKSQHVPTLFDCQRWRQQHQPHRQHQQQERHASTGGLTVQQKKKASRALKRARRVRESSMATVLSGEDWTGYEGTMRQGLRELDDTAEMKRRGTYASKPLVSRLFEDDDDGVDGRMSELEAWADKVEGIWNDILQADSLAGKPRVSLPGFPIEVVKVKIARDFGHQKIFWDFTKGATRPPGTLLRQLHEARNKGYNARAVVLKSTAERLRKREGYLRANLAQRIPMRRVPEVRWQHISEMPISLRLEG